MLRSFLFVAIVLPLLALESRADDDPKPVEIALDSLETICLANVRTPRTAFSAVRESGQWTQLTPAEYEAVAGKALKAGETGLQHVMVSATLLMTLAYKTGQLNCALDLTHRNARGLKDLLKEREYVGKAPRKGEASVLGPPEDVLPRPSEEQVDRMKAALGGAMPPGSAGWALLGPAVEYGAAILMNRSRNDKTLRVVVIPMSLPG